MYKIHQELEEARDCATSANLTSVELHQALREQGWQFQLQRQRLSSPAEVQAQVVEAKQVLTLPLPL